ncbi:PREDICTED: putative uncharacterized protein DDB_G0285119 [Nicrophorus vespilloides]|uniref:Shugoshin C-terminal domain-containing protein n=1 Tax=Nicrophorus vespilloides TaxID=110193 RepID=A0ABM1M9Z5_NICVS|nr:PREDICTED: putative uncharacterized protein DDB_G0285119 [Nicrophorus vespilloides]
MPKVSRTACSSTTINTTNMDFLSEENTYLRTKNRELAKALGDMKSEFNNLRMKNSSLYDQSVSQLLTNRNLMHALKNINGDAIEALTMIGRLSEVIIKIMNDTKVVTESSVIETENPNHKQNSSRRMVSDHFLMNPTVTLRRCNIDNLNEDLQRRGRDEEINSSLVNITPMDQLVEEPENSNSPQNDDLENNDPNQNDCSEHPNLTTVQEIDEDNLSQTIVHPSSTNISQHLSPLHENMTSRKRNSSPLITRRNKKLNMNKSPFSMSSLNSSLSNNFGSSEVSLSVTNSDTSITASTTPARRKNVASKQLEETFNPSLQSTSTPYKFESNKMTDLSKRNTNSNIDNCKVMLTRLPLPLISAISNGNTYSKSDDDSDESTLIESNTHLSKTNLKSSAGKRKVLKTTKSKSERASSSINSTKDSQADEISINTRPKRNAAPKSMKEPSLNSRMRRP